MAHYDGKNKYPKNAKPLDRKRTPTVSEANVTMPSVDGPDNPAMGGDEEPLEKRLLRQLNGIKKDMDKLTKERADIHRFYLAEKLGNEVKGRSQVVMSDVSDTIEAVMPSMMKIFYGGKDVVEIGERGPEDEHKAKLMEEKVNFDIQKQNDGFQLIYSFIKDALLYKQGVIKYRWEKRVVTEKKKYAGLTADEVRIVISNPDFTPTSATAKFSGFFGKEKKVTENVLENLDLYPDATIDLNGEVITEKISKPVLENVPPEEFMFDIRAKKLDDSFVAHRKKVHWKTLRKYGLEYDDIKQEVDYFDTTEANETLRTARLDDIGGRSFITDDRSDRDAPRSIRHVYIYECFYDDYDEDGVKIPMVALLFGRRVLKSGKNSYKRPPFCLISPILITHRLCGRSLAELVVEIQKLKTALVRYILDNIYFQNNGFRIVNPYRLDVNSYLNGNKPGGVAFTSHDIDPKTAVYDLPVQPIAVHTLKMLEYTEVIKENRTGVTRYNQGIDAKSLNKTATGITQIMNAAQQRIELIARVFAETGFKDLVEALVQMNLDYFDITENIKINQKWQEIKPEDISGKYDVVIEVGSGTGTKDMQYQQKVQMLNIYSQIAQVLGPATTEIFDANNIRNMLQTMWEDLGYRNTTQYVKEETPTAPGTPGQLPPEVLSGQPAEGAGGNGQAGGVAFSESDIAGILQGSGAGLPQ